MFPTAYAFKKVTDYCCAYINTINEYTENLKNIKPIYTQL